MGDGGYGQFIAALDGYAEWSSQKYREEKELKERINLAKGGVEKLRMEYLESEQAKIDAELLKQVRLLDDRRTKILPTATEYAVMGLAITALHFPLSSVSRVVCPVSSRNDYYGAVVVGKFGVGLRRNKVSSPIRNRAEVKYLYERRAQILLGCVALHIDTTLLEAVFEVLPDFDFFSPEEGMTYSSPALRVLTMYLYSDASNGRAVSLYTSWYDMLCARFIGRNGIVNIVSCSSSNVYSFLNLIAVRPLLPGMIEAMKVRLDEEEKKPDRVEYARTRLAKWLLVNSV